MSDTGSKNEAGGGWRISSFNGALLAAYFIPTWTIIAFNIMVSPIHGFYQRPNVAIALFISDHWQLATMPTVRLAWLLALARITTVAFFALFLVFITRPSIRKSGGCDEALAMALGIGSVLSFVSMVLASKVGEMEALRMHAAELLVMLGTAIVMALEKPAQATVKATVPAGELSLQHT
jgi:hypothetical protein